MKLTKDQALLAHTKTFANGMSYSPNKVNAQIIQVSEEYENYFLKTLAQNEFFKLISIFKTEQEEGETVGIVQLLGGTTDTRQNARKPKAGFLRNKFNCEQVNFDSFISYQKLDAFIGETENYFLEKYECFLNKQLQKSILMIGFNGLTRSNDSEPENNKLAQDVKKGWLQKIRDNAQEKGLSNVLNIGEISNSARFTSLNQAVKEGVKRITPIYTDGDLIAICGRGVIGEKPLENDATELKNSFVTRLQNPIAGVKAIYLPYFPDDCILLTRLENLAFYFRKGTLRRGYSDKPENDLLTHFFSFSFDFVVENFDACCLLENIEITE